MYYLDSQDWIIKHPSEFYRQWRNNWHDLYIIERVYFECRGGFSICGVPWWLFFLRPLWKIISRGKKSIYKVFYIFFTFSSSCLTLPLLLTYAMYDKGRWMCSKTKDCYINQDKHFVFQSNIHNLQCTFYNDCRAGDNPVSVWQGKPSLHGLNVWESKKYSF